MDQYDYYSLCTDFKQFLNEYELDLDTSDLNTDLNTNLNIKMKKHIENLHSIIYQELEKNQEYNPFLLKLKSEINKYLINK